LLGHALKRSDVDIAKQAQQWHRQAIEGAAGDQKHLEQETSGGRMTNSRIQQLQ